MQCLKIKVKCKMSLKGILKLKMQLHPSVGKVKVKSL
jgi:hypothetical protein